MGRFKQLLLIIMVIGQLLGIGMLFVNIKIAVFIFIIYGLAVIGLFTLIIVERLKEKEEDDGNDYRDY